MIQPGVYNIRLQRRADFSVILEFKDSNKVAIDLNGWEIVAQVWDLARENKYADFAVEYLDRTQGKAKLKLSHLDTTHFPGEATYDVMLIAPNGEREYYLEGGVMVSEGYTSVP